MVDESQDGIKIAGRNVNNLRYANDATLITESKEELRNLLMRVKEESEKAGLELNIKKTNKQKKKTKLMGSSPTTSLQIDVEKVADFIFLGSKITADGDCSRKIKRCFLLGRKAITNIDNVLKTRDNTLLTKDHIVKAMAFPVVMYRCDVRVGT